MNMHRPPALAVPRWKILGVDVAVLGWDEAITLLKRLLAERRFTRVGFLNAHNANIAFTEPAFAAALRDFLILPDGFGVDIAARLLQGRTFPANLNGTDFVPALFEACPEPLTVGLLGAKRANAEAAAKKFMALAPQHRFEVIHDGYFPPEEEPAILKRIGELKPDVLLVAMGVPRQELWIARHITPSHCTMPIAVGALLDFMSGAVPRAPLWVRRTRSEWIYRLYREPRRLWQRYILGNPVFLARVLRQKFLPRG